MLRPSSDSPERNRRFLYRFGALSIDPATRELKRNGDLLSVAPKAFDCIAYLLANRDRAVGHDELAAAVWGRADVTDVQLRQLMRKVRRILNGDDDSDHQSVIRTIPHFGFHWTAETTLEEVLPEPRREDADAQVRHEPDKDADATRSTWRMYPRASTALALALLLVTVLVVWSIHFVERRIDTRTDSPRTSADIGVLPTQIESGSEVDTAWMRLGLMDFVANRLRRSSVAVVPSSDMVALSRGQPAGEALTRHVRSATGASGIVESTASRRNNGWLVRLALRRPDDSERAAEAYSPDALLAAGEASDRLLALLGKPVPAPTAPEFAPSNAELLQRVESALLVDDFTTAQRLIESAPPTVVDLPEFQLNLARIESATDQDAKARDRLQKLLLRISADDAPLLRGRALTELGFLDALAPEQSLREYGEAIELLGTQDDPEHLGRAYAGRAVTYSLAREYSLAKADYAKARVMMGMTNDALRLAGIDGNEAALEGSFGHNADALPLLERASATMERYGAINKLITPVCNQITTLLALLRPAEALTVYRRMRPRVAGAGSPESLHFLDYLGALALSFNGRLAEAGALTASVSNAADRQEETSLISKLGALRAELDLTNGDLQDAVAHATRSIGDRTGQRRLADSQADAWLILTRALRDTGDLGEAQLQTQRFAGAVDERTPPGTALRARLAEAEQYWSSGQLPKALDTYEKATQVAEQIGTPYDIRLVAESYAGALIDAGHLENATTVVGRIGRWSSTDFNSALLEARFYRALGQRDAWRQSLDKVRLLAGERAIPAGVNTPPPAPVSLVQTPR